jgi:hypothetical protein
MERGFRWSRAALLALGLAAAAAAGVPASADDAGPRLPPAPSITGAVHRGPNGELEVFDPTQEKGAAPRLCDKGAICVGPDQAFTKLSDAASAARDGDLIEVVAATYHDTATIDRANVTVRGIKGRPHFDCAGIPPSGNKACLLITGNNITLDNLEISGAVLPPSLGENGACIRNGRNNSFTIRNVICHGSQDGILSDGGTIVIDKSEFYDNGWTGYTHNVYFSGNCNSVTVRGSTFRDARIGHEFKSRCAETNISDSTFRSTKGSRDLDIPDGGATLVERSTLTKTASADSEEIVGFAAESCRIPGDMILKDVRIINSKPNASIHNFDKCQGHPIILENVTEEGLPVANKGNVVKR